MSQKEREYLKTLWRVKRKELKLSDASRLLGLSYRQTQRIYKRYKEEGDRGLIHRSRGRKSNRGYNDEFRAAVIVRYKNRYEGFGPTLGAEKLEEEDGFKVDHETLRRWLLREGLWARERRRGRHRSWRERKAHFGEMLQMDGSHHEWFEDRGERCCLMNAVDDATGWTMSLLDRQETIYGAMTLLWNWIDRFGIPVSVYTDRKNIFASPDKGPSRIEEAESEELTQFARACKSLGIRLILARSPQAKGRVERSNGTYQKRLLLELRLKNISELEPANKLLYQARFQDKLNLKFAVAPRNPVDYHRSAKGRDLASIFCIQQQRTITTDWIVRFENSYYQLKRQSRYGPARGKVMVRRYLNGELHFNYRGKDIPYQQLDARPQATAKQQKRWQPKRLKKKWIPPKDHPWRGFRFGRGVTTD
jgi:molybdenum-dependent DNA-binding transcriptional regulator ModE